MEKIIETKVCKCGEKFNITDRDLEFFEKVSPIFNGKKYLIPSPTLYPDCRQQRRLSFRNERKLYKRKCDLTGDSIVSMYSPDKPYKVFDQKEWWSDKWSALDYGREYDFSKGFFEQFEELIKQVPRLSLTNFAVEDSEYVNCTNDSKNCYLCYASGFSENLYYSKWTYYSEDSLDNLYSNNLKKSYYIIDSNTLYDCYYCQNCKNLINCSFCYSCEGCKECIGCIGLNNKEYYIYNKPFSKEEYFNQKEKILKNLLLVKNEFNKLLLNFPHKLDNNSNAEDSSGEYCINTKNSINCFGAEKVEDCKNGIDITNGSYIWDSNNTGYGEIIYETIGGGYYNKLGFINFCAELNNSYYCESCFSSSNLFGCSGLRNKEYCILNKQYTKEEYEELVPKIIEHMKSTGEWGEFFPSSISPFGYNETVASEYFPMSKDEALSKGFKWSDYEAPFPKVSKTIPASKLPDDISSIPDDILNWAIECEVSGKPFRIIKQELEFYRKHGLPIPRRHPDVRHMDRMKLRNPRKLYDRKCDKCSIDIKTTYSPDRPEIVYCEECYNGEVV